MSTTFPYLNVHVLRPVAAANPNRDDQGAPKTVTYGGTTRARLSSASQNRAARVDFEQNSPADRTVRSAHTARRLAEQIAGTDTPSDELVDYLTRSINGLTAKAETTDAKDTLVWLEQAKIDQLAADAAANIAAGGDTPLNFDDLTQTTALAVAAFGRMFAARPDLQLEAAVSVAHAITTHTAATEIDYFTAVDDDPNADQGAGAGHIGLKMLTSGIFYSYLLLDRPQLHRNWVGAGSAHAADRVTALWRSLLCTAPTGMTTKAPIGALPALVVVAEAAQPASLAAAFEKPVPAHGDGWLEPSIDRLAAWADSTISFGGPSTFGQVWWTTTVPDHTPAGGTLTAANKAATLDDLLGQLTAWTLTK